MKPFVFDSAVVDPMDVARRDYMEYFVDKILQHRGNPKKFFLHIYKSWKENYFSHKVFFIFVG